MSRHIRGGRYVACATHGRSGNRVAVAAIANIGAAGVPLFLAPQDAGRCGRRTQSDAAQFRCRLYRIFRRLSAGFNFSPLPPTAGSEGNLDIWVQQDRKGEPLRLTLDPSDDSQPSFSPDGTRSSTVGTRVRRRVRGCRLLAERSPVANGCATRISADARILYWCTGRSKVHRAWLGSDLRWCRGSVNAEASPSEFGAAHHPVRTTEHPMPAKTFCSLGGLRTRTDVTAAHWNGDAA